MGCVKLNILDQQHKTNITYTNKELTFNFSLKNVCRYLVYGEILTNKRSAGSNYNTPYKFSAKEKDAETGFNYHGARYYIDYMYVWMSPDPLSDEYPSTSPYMYCSGNPVMRVDLNGMEDTDYGITSYGKIIQIGPTNNEPDRLFAVNHDGTKKNNNFVTIEKGSISNVDNKLIGVYYDQDPISGQTTINPAYGIMVKGDDNAEKIFSFIADNVSVEFTRAAVGENSGKNGINVISTSNKLNSEGGSQSIANYCIANSIKIRGMDHNHPRNNPNPSGMDGDRGFATELEKHYPNIILRIYTKSDHKFHNYSSFGPTLSPCYVK